LTGLRVYRRVGLSVPGGWKRGVTYACWTPSILCPRQPQVHKRQTHVRENRRAMARTSPQVCGAICQIHTTRCQHNFDTTGILRIGPPIVGGEANLPRRPCLVVSKIGTTPDHWPVLSTKGRRPGVHLNLRSCPSLPTVSTMWLRGVFVPVPDLRFRDAASGLAGALARGFVLE